MNFNKIIEKVLEHEGGYVNDPTDLGGETKYGITKRFYPDVDIKNLTKDVKYSKVARITIINSYVSKDTQINIR